MAPTFSQPTAEKYPTVWLLQMQMFTFVGKTKNNQHVDKCNYLQDETAIDISFTAN